MITKTLTILSEEGLHARPASILAKAAIKFESELFMYKEGEMNKKYQPKSILSLLTLGAAKGENIVFTASGEDEVEAMNMIEALIQSDFR
ncbi:MAG: HPr family phosphocarrier protein [Firmicutes bacterium HGW-Firmicutes-5]|nr:MAG: HPr family phosphocarrier protein [Firmicutes bacterium HGW-Firmicutes-5]